MVVCLSIVYIINHYFFFDFMSLINTPSRYYEGVLQLRNPTRQIMDFIICQLKKEDVGVVKEVHVPEGLDIYVNSRKFLRTLANRLKTQFGGDVTLSARLFTQDKNTQKGIYRVSLLYKAPLLKKGEIVLYNNRIIKIKNVAKFVTGTDIKTGKQISFLHNPKMEALEIFETRTVKVRPHIEVLHPSTYQAIEVMNTKEIKAGEKVKIVFVNHDCYLV